MLISLLFAGMLARSTTTVDIIRKTFGEDTGRATIIAYCEGGLRQFTETGEVLRGRINHNDSGLFQIHVPIWGKTAEKLNIDLETLEGNVKMAKYIKDTQGWSAWAASSKCQKSLEQKEPT